MTDSSPALSMKIQAMKFMRQNRLNPAIATSKRVFHSTQRVTVHLDWETSQPSTFSCKRQFGKLESNEADITDKEFANTVSMLKEKRKSIDIQVEDESTKRINIKKPEKRKFRQLLTDLDIQ